MGFDFSVFFSAGLKDALGSVSLGVAGVLALALFSLRQANKGVALAFSLVFMAILVLGGVVADLRFLDLLITTTEFLQCSAWIFLGLGVLFLVLGGMFFREWGSLRRGSVDRGFVSFIPVVTWGKFTAVCVAFIVASGLGLVANIWPANYQIVYQGQLAFLPGSLFHSIGVLLIYEVLRNAAAWLLIAVFFLAQRRRNMEFLRHRRSLVSIILSAVFLAVGGSLVFFFYTAVTKPWF